MTFAANLITGDRWVGHKFVIKLFDLSFARMTSPNDESPAVTKAKANKFGIMLNISLIAIGKEV